MKPLKRLSLLVIVLTIFLSSCRTSGISFQPNFAPFNLQREAIVTVEGEIIPCYDPKILEWYAMHCTKILELREVLDRNGMKKKEVNRLAPKPRGCN